MALVLPIPARSLGLEMMETSEVQPKVNPVAWQEVGRRIVGVFSRAKAEDDSDDEWMLPCAEQEPEPEQEAAPEAAEEAAWAEVGRRLAGAFSAALADEDAEEDEDWEAPCRGPVAVEVGCGGARAAAKGTSSPALSASVAPATPATLPSTAPGTPEPSEIDLSEAPSDSEEAAAAKAAPADAASPAFSTLLSLHSEDVRASQPEQRLASTSGDDDSAEHVDPAREEVAFRGLCGRIARVFEDASSSEEDANTDGDDDDRVERVGLAREDVAFRGLCGRIARVFQDATDSDEE